MAYYLYVLRLHAAHTQLYILILAVYNVYVCVCVRIISVLDLDIFAFQSEQLLSFAYYELQNS